MAGNLFAADLSEEGIHDGVDLVTTHQDLLDDGVFLVVEDMGAIVGGVGGVGGWGDRDGPRKHRRFAPNY